MPEIDGFTVLTRIKESFPDVRVIIMTGLFTKSQNKSEALQEFKADAFLKKPVDFAELKTVLDDLLGSAAPAPSP